MKKLLILFLSFLPLMNMANAQTTISLSQLIGTEWEQVLEREQGFTRHLSLSQNVAKWTISDAVNGDMVIEREYYLSDKEAAYHNPFSDYPDNPFDKSQVGVNKSGKYLYVCDEFCEESLFYIVKQIDDEYLYLERPGSYFISKEGLKVTVSKGGIMKLKRIRHNQSQPACLNGNPALDVQGLSNMLNEMYNDYFYYRNDLGVLQQMFSNLCSADLCATLMSDLRGDCKEYLTNGRKDYDQIKRTMFITSKDGSCLEVSFRSAKSQSDPIETVTVKVFYNNEGKICRIEAGN